MPLETGAKLGPYVIVELIGTGGMGEVYRARDPRLSRDVAVKVVRGEIAIDSDRVRRLEREAKATGALNHPNILAVYDVGTHQGAPYVVSELLEGQTLRARLQGGALPLRQAIDYGAQIARGLAAAHAKAIVHRDLKPENIFVTGDGRVKILDFGLAKLTLLGPVDMESGTTAPPATESGHVVGTSGYMSPEQVRGEPVDHRSDLFSFGTVLYEMLSGVRAFRRGSGAEIHAAILRDDPPSVSGPGRAVPRGLESLLHRCLEKRPEERFQSAHDLALALEAAASKGAEPTHVRPLVLAALIGLVVVGVAAWSLWPRLPRSSAPPSPVPGRIESVAVLPFENVGGDPEYEYLSDGLPAELINRLAGHVGLRVAPRSLSFDCRRGAADGICDPLELGRRLGVRAVVVGRVARPGDRLAIGVELIDVNEAAQLWGQRYDDRAGLDALRVVDRVAGDVGAQLGYEPLGGELPTNSGEAFDLYLKGLQLWSELSPATIDEAIGYFQRSAAVDPGFALPHEGLANVYSTIGYQAMAAP